MGERVAIMEARRYDADLVVDKLSRAFDALGMKLPRQAKVLLKPNIVSQNTPRQCTTTHPAVMEALCRLLSDSGNRVTIGESSAFYQGGHTLRAFKASGIEDVALRCGARLVAFEREPLKLFHNDDNMILKEILLPRELDDADFIVSVGKLKTHSFFEFSGTVKNLFGCIPGSAKFEYHYKEGFGQALFGQKLADVWNIIRPSLGILDAIWALEGFGPAATGTPKNMGLLFVAQNAWALDYVAARCAGFDPEKLDGARAGIERGFLKDPGSIQLCGDFSTAPVVPLKRAPVAPEKSRETNAIYKLVAVRMEVREKRCTACGDCVKECPLAAIVLVEETGCARIDRGLCLVCLHCAYVCPAKAIEIRGASKMHLAGRAARRIAKI